MRVSHTLRFVAAAVLSLAPRCRGEGLLWEDWDRRQVCRPASYAVPADEAALVAAVRAAANANATLKVVGAGHSFSAIALADEGGHMISLDAMSSLVSVDEAAMEVTVEAGMRLHDLNAALDARGLALANLGATCEQSVAGATATGTHGTGRLLGSTATFITAVRLVAANGSVVVASRAESPKLFAAARLGLGALGVLSQLTLAVEPQFYLRLNNTIMPLDNLLAALPALNAQYERLQWYWAPPDEENATLVTRERVAGPPSGGSGGCWDDAALGAHGDPPSFFRGAEHPRATAAATHTSCTDVSYKALCGSPAHYAARNLYTEMEMFVPSEDVGAAIADFRAYQAAVLPLHDAATPLFTGVRYVAADEDVLLSPQAGGRDNAVISFIVTGDSGEATGDFGEFERYARYLENMTTTKFAGRPHWGKMHWATATTLRPSYDTDGGWSAFLTQRAALDPRGVFLNDYLVSHFGL